MIAIIAGIGSLPIEACRQLKSQSRPFFVIVLFPEDNLVDIQQVVPGNDIVAHEFYKASSIRDTLLARKTTKVLFIGKVDKQHLLKHIKFDWLAIKFFASLVTSKSDKAIMERLLEELAGYGIEVIRQDEVLGGLMVLPGVLTGTLTKELKKNIAFGMQTALTISQHAIGQSVIVKDLMVLAIEAIEGTDACIKRGIELGKSGIIVCKAAHARQNRKFDLPTLGPTSLTGIQKGQVAAIAWDSRSTFIADKNLFTEEANALDITLVSWSDEGELD